MFRNQILIFFREICEGVVTVEKEIARQKAEEILKKEEEERQKFIDINAAEVCSVHNAEAFKKSYIIIYVSALEPNFSILQSTFHKHLYGIV